MWPKEFHVKFHHLFLRPGDLLKSSINLRATGRPSVYLRQLSVCLGDLPSTSDNLQCGKKIFRTQKVEGNALWHHGKLMQFYGRSPVGKES